MVEQPLIVLNAEARADLAQRAAVRDAIRRYASGEPRPCAEPDPERRLEMIRDAFVKSARFRANYHEAGQCPTPSQT